MQVLVSGASGLVGTALCESLQADGHAVSRLVRRAPHDPAERPWRPNEGELDATVLNGVDAVVHLSGENVGDGRWTDAKKRAIQRSRVDSTRLLAEAFGKAGERPAVFVCASAVGYYGHRGDEVLTEDAPPGDDFLAQVCVAWEAACRPAVEAGARVVHLRFGVVLSPEGGALATMLPVFKAGLGGVVAGGDQYMSWVTRADAVRAVEHALTHEEVSGPVNVTGPEPVTNRTFTRALGNALGRPTIAPLPAFAARVTLGAERAEALLLNSIRAVPERLTASGFTFTHPSCGPALQALLR